MVKVVEQGYFKLTCWKCKSVLEYSFQETRTYKANMDYLGDYDVVVGIVCPNCATVNKHVHS